VTRGARVTLLAAALLLAGCGQAGYVLRQGWRQFKALRARQPLARVMRRRDLPSDWREKLVVSQLARRYAEEVIGLRRTAAYTTFLDTGSRPVAWNLSACARDRLRPKTWRFPLVGEVPYLGYLDEGEARRAKDELDRQGLDTDLRPVNAWSSLGWFADPLTSGMLSEDVARLSEVIIHELTHSTIYVRGHAAFNESLAVFVGDHGALAFLTQLYGPLSAEAQRYLDTLRRQQRFNALIEELYDRLERLYASARPAEDKLREREAHFRWAQERYRELFPPERWGRFGRTRLNNAVLLNYGRYNQGLRFHEQVYRKLGRDLPRLVALYRAATRYPDPVRRVADWTGVPLSFRQQH
jgi:predicted aminopeptidase